MNIIDRWNHFMTSAFSYETSFIMICTYIIVGLLGLVIGSFLNVVIYRVPEGMSISYPPSHCTKCNYKLKWYDNIPVISYIILKGKCRSCKEHISFRYTLVELGNMVLYLLCVYMFFDAKQGGIANRGNVYMIPYTILCMIACSTLLCIAFIDLEHTYIPDRFQIILASLGLIAIICNFIGFNDGISWLDRVIGAAGSLALFVIIYFAGMLAYKREAMGIGDIKLVTAAGLLLGWKNMILAVLIGALVGAIVLSILRRVRNDEKEHEYPLGPFLAFGILIAMFFGDSIINAYLTLL